MMRCVQCLGVAEPVTAFRLDTTGAGFNDGHLDGPSDLKALANTTVTLSPETGGPVPVTLPLRGTDIKVPILFCPQCGFTAGDDPRNPARNWLDEDAERAFVLELDKRMRDLHREPIDVDEILPHWIRIVASVSRDEVAGVLIGAVNDKGAAVRIWPTGSHVTTTFHLPPEVSAHAWAKHSGCSSATTKAAALVALVERRSARRLPAVPLEHAIDQIAIRAKVEAVPGAPRAVVESLARQGKDPIRSIPGLRLCRRVIVGCYESEIAAAIKEERPDPDLVWRGGVSELCEQLRLKPKYRGQLSEAIQWGQWTTIISPGCVRGGLWTHEIDRCRGLRIRPAGWIWPSSHQEILAAIPGFVDLEEIGVPPWWRVGVERAMWLYSRERSDPREPDCEKIATELGLPVLAAEHIERAAAIAFAGAQHAAFLAEQRTIRRNAGKGGKARARAKRGR